MYFKGISLSNPRNIVVEEEFWKVITIEIY